MPYHIEFEEHIDSRTISQVPYKESTIVLKLNDVVLETLPYSKLHTRIRKQLIDRYWNIFETYCLDGCKIVVCLSGWHFNPFEIQDYKVYRGRGNNMTVHYNQWDMGKYSNLQKYAIIECNRPLFKKLFKKYWLNVFWEIRFEGYVIPVDDTKKVMDWCEQETQKRNYDDLLAMSKLKIDNMEHGFHYMITAKENVFRELIRKIDGFEFS